MIKHKLFVVFHRAKKIKQKPVVVFHRGGGGVGGMTKQKPVVVFHRGEND